MKDLGYPKSHRILSKGDYRRVAKASLRLRGAFLVLEVRKKDRGLTRLGITASKKYGKAYSRNRFKRSVRESFRLLYPRLPSSLDIIVRPRIAAHHATMREIQQELLVLLKGVFRG